MGCRGDSKGYSRFVPADVGGFAGKVVWSKMISVRDARSRAGREEGVRLEGACEARSMLLEIAKPIALLLCMLALWSVFYTAFLVPASDLERRSWDSLILLSLAAGICLTSGMIFRESSESGAGSLARTLPIQMFC